jgi:hypothetical protein
MVTMPSTEAAIIKATRAQNWDIILQEITKAIAANSETQGEAEQRLAYMLQRADGWADIAVKQVFG